jgi:2-polyprenyl-3-methyl-5-hydroxy-6-metoxy-1,4-benzoquinol methylase
MKISDKSGLYSHYISTHFGKIHTDSRDFIVQLPYFKKNYLKHLPADKSAKILDLGCGMGHFLNFLENEGYKNYLGIDLSEENIEFCKKNGFNVKHGNIFDFLRNSPGSFDAIIMNDIIEHLEKTEILELLKIILTKLNSGGRLIIKAPNASNPIMASSSRYYDFTHELLFTEESLSQVLRISGFTKVSIYPQDLYVFYYNPLNYLAKFFNFLLNGTFHVLFVFYGRKTTRVFTKNLIAVAIKEG